MSILKNTMKLDLLIDKLLTSIDLSDDAEYYDQRVEELQDQLKTLTTQYNNADNHKTKKCISFQINEIIDMIKEYEHLRKELEFKNDNFQTDHHNEELIFTLDE